MNLCTDPTLDVTTAIPGVWGNGRNSHKPSEFEVMSPPGYNSQNLPNRRNKSLIVALYSGKQCSSCERRFKPEQVLQYSQHLDWHFRYNKRQRKSTSEPYSRMFYLSTEDWLMFEEIDDGDNKVPIVFELEDLNATIPEEEAEKPSVAVSPDSTSGVCPVCQEAFSQFFHQEAEEWRYENVKRVDGANFHPDCYQDMLVRTISLIPPETREKLEDLQVNWAQRTAE
nr:pre-mRNA cleavage complex 2 protein Pcf11-like [Cherax quadricarinatus]